MDDLRDPTERAYIQNYSIYFCVRPQKLYSLAQESGRTAAKYFINTYPKYFQKDFANPHIPCLMPETLELQVNEVSEAALIERIQLRKVKAAVDMYDQLLQAGTPVSLDLTNDLLDLISLYGDCDPARGDAPEQRTEEMVSLTLTSNNNAERIFNMMPERNRRSYGALIRGMVKHGAYSKAFNTYTDLLNNRLTGDVHIFNALISAAPEVREKYVEKWDLIVDLLKQMAEQKVKPTLLTFNAVLKALRRCGSLGRTQAFPVINEMKALGIATSAQGHTEILQDVLSEISGKSFTAQDPDDGIIKTQIHTFLLFTDSLCDIEQAYRVHSLLGVGENWKLLGDSYYQSIYYGRFFNLLCMMEHIDVVLKWYKELIPSLYYPNSQGMRDLLQALDTDNRLDLIPQIWKDIKRMGHDNKTELVEEMLSLMARENQIPEVQQSFADCALDVKALYTQTDRRVPLSWSAGSLSSITSILLAAERTQQAWEMLKLFKLANRVPESLMNQFLESVKASNNAQQAVELVQISASFCLSITPNLMERVQQEFDLTEEQRNTLSDLESSTAMSD
uniref:Small ribosomal subunit protein mS39 n=1 Tax=Pygocentrus nattereri TaxID=42514 RepID=A0A3B4CP79_PYGNA